MIKMATNKSIYKGFSLTCAILLISGCSMSFSIPFLTSEPEGPPVINEPSLESLAIEPVNLPPTKLPSASLEQAKTSYLNLLKSTNSTDLKAESLQRLAEIESMIAENSFDDDDPMVGNTHLKLAAGYYQTLLEQHPDKIAKSKIQYQLARILELEGEPASAQNILGELAELKGNDFEVIEARFRMAENAYSTKSYTTALELYSQVLMHKNDPSKGQLNSFYNTALFKRGWTNFKKLNYDLAVDDFASLLDIIYIAPENRTSANKSLINETYRVTALSLSYMEGADSLAEYFSENGHKTFEAELYLALANLYMQQQRFQDTANTYFAFVASNPEHQDAPKFEHKGIGVLSLSGFVDLVLAAKENFVENYQTGANYWTATGLKRSELVSKWLYKNLDDVINFHHAQAQQTKKKPEYLMAAKWYRIFLNSFSNHPKAIDKRWLLAETLYDAGDNLASIIEYQILAYQDNNLSPKRKEEAAYRIILGRQKLFTELETTTQKTPDSLNVARQELIDEGLKFKTVFINSKRVPKVLAQTIELQLSQGQTEQAVVQSRSMLITKWASNEHLKRSREVIANGEFDLQNYKNAELAFTQIFAQDQHSKAKMQVFHERRAQTIYKQAEQFNQAKQYPEAIEEFLRLAQVEPNSKVRVNAEFDAASLLLQIKSYSRAVIVLQQFAKRYPSHSLAESIPAKLIVAFEALSDWQGAAQQYEYVASTSNDTEVARTATWQAGMSWMKLSDESSQNTAVALWKKYIKAYPKPYDLSLEARNNLINLYGSLKVKWKQDFWRRKIILTVDTYKIEDIRARTLAAQSQLSLSNDIFTTYKVIKLTQPLKRSLGKKRSKLKSTLAGYSKVLDYRIQPLSTQAGHKIGESYALLAKSIFNSERPKGMSDIELEEYDTLLEERVFPIEDQAIDAFEANVSLTQSNVWDQWIKQSFAQLEILLPARYKKPEVIDDYATTP
jgi:tetratricopeptide (TPR) repeat protein